MDSIIDPIQRILRMALWGHYEFCFLVVSIKFVSVFVKNLKNALQCKCDRRKSRCWLPVWWSMNKAFFFKPKCSTSWALETQFHPRLLPLLLFGLPAVSFMFYYVTMQCLLMCKFRHNTHTVSCLEFPRLFGAQKTTSNNCFLVQSEDGRSKDFEIMMCN